MANPEFSVTHVATRSDLPDELTQGRLYFIEDEGSIVINHGEGPVTYADPTLARYNNEDIQELLAVVRKLGSYSLYKIHGESHDGLGPVITEEQIAHIQDRSYKGIVVGASWWSNTGFDYKWTDNAGEEHEANSGAYCFRVGAFADYFMTGSNSNSIPSSGGLGLAKGAVVLYHQTPFGSAPMDDSNTKTTGYGECSLRKSDLMLKYRAMIKAWAGDYLLTMKDMLPNAVDANGNVTGWAAYPCTVELPSAEMMGYIDPHTNGFNFHNNRFMDSNYVKRMHPTWLRTQSGMGKYLRQDRYNIQPQAATTNYGVRGVFLIG